MASISCNSGYQSIRLAVAVSLVLVLFASTAPSAQAFSRARPWSTTPGGVPPLSVKFVNNLTQALSVTTSQSTTLAPGAGAVVTVDAETPLQFEVSGALYIDSASGPSGALASLAAEVGVLSIVVVNGPCATGQAGLTLKSYSDAKLVDPKGCAVRQ